MKKIPLLFFIIFANYANLPASDFSESDFSEIDEIVSNGIRNNYFPGAQLLIGNENDILYSKCYGNFTYDEFSEPVTNESIFDLASLTKVVATTPALMILFELKKVDLNDKVSVYIPEFANNGKEEITVLNLLLHNSGLTAFMRFYDFCSSKDEVLNTIYNAGLEYPVNSKCVYSDLNAILLGVIVEKVSGQKLDEFCRNNIFLPLDMHSTTFVPDEKMKQLALPTENDTYWRNRQLKGEVHDEAAAMLEGISGNAGLFSNAIDLYKYMKVLLAGGTYYNPYTRGLKEEKLFDSSTIDFFTKRVSDLGYYNTRALGWDTKPEKTSRYRIPCGEMISENCFGHTGYTGTSIWCDTDKKLIIIFLTNRIYPSRNNDGIREIRPELHNAAIKICSTQN